MKLLNEHDRTAILNALQVARERFAECQKTLLTGNENMTPQERAGMQRLADQFKRQEQDMLRLSDELQEYDGVALHNENDMLRSRRA